MKKIEEIKITVDRLIDDMHKVFMEHPNTMDLLTLNIVLNLLIDTQEQLSEYLENTKDVPN